MPIKIILRMAGVALIAITAHSLHGADYYVDKDASGAGTGASWADAWTSFASVTWGTGANQVGPGDTLYISGGSTSKNYGAVSWTVGAAGSSDASRVIIRVGQDAGHNGTVIFDYDSLGDSATANGITVSQNYVTIDGSVGGVSKLQINNLRHTTNRNACYGIYSSNATGLVIRYVSSDNCSNAIRAQYATGEEIAYCSLTNQRGDAAISVVSGGTTAFDSSRIHHNTIHCLVKLNGGIPYGPDGIQTHSGVTVDNNTFSVSVTTAETSSQHTDYLQVQGSHIKIHSNTFTNIGDSAIDYDGYADTSLSDLWIYNNVFRITTDIDPYSEFIRIYNSSGSITSITNLKIWNNVFADNDAWDCINIASCATATVSNSEIKNNIFTNCGNGQYHPAILIRASSNWTAADWDTDANIYSRTGTHYVGVDQDAPITVTAAAWVAANEPNGSTSAPAFVDATGGDFRPTAGAIQIDAGVSLASSFTTDADGVTRSGTWDIGAYEYVSTSAPDAPTSPTATATSTTTITVGWTDNDDSPDETSFRIERSLTSGSGFSEIGTAAANATSYTNTGLAPGVTYYYRIRARNAGGDSAYTAEASAMTNAIATMSGGSRGGAATGARR